LFFVRSKNDFRGAIKQTTVQQVPQSSIGNNQNLVGQQRTSNDRPYETAQGTYWPPRIRIIKKKRIHFYLTVFFCCS